MTAWTAWPSSQRRTRGAWSTVPSERRATRPCPPWSRRWPPRTPSAATRRRPAARSCVRPRRAGCTADSDSMTCRPRRSRRASAPRSSSPRCRTCLRLRDARAGHRAVSRRVVPDLRHGCGACRLPRGAGPPAGRATGGLDLEAIDHDDAAPRPGAVVELAVQPDGRARRPRRRGGMGSRPRRAGVLRRVLRRVHLGRPTALGPPGRDGRGGRRALPVEAFEPGRAARGVLCRGPRARRVPARRAPARRSHGPRPGPGRRRRLP